MNESSRQHVERLLRCPLRSMLEVFAQNSAKSATLVASPKTSSNVGFVS